MRFLIVIAALNDFYKNPNLIIEYSPLIVIAIIFITIKFVKKIKNKKRKSRSGLKIEFKRPSSIKVLKKKNVFILGLIIMLMLINNQNYLDISIYYIDKYFSYIVIAYVAVLLFLLKDKIINKIKNHKISKSGINDIDLMTGQEFEEYLEILFNKKGYAVETTPISGDFGADLILIKDSNRIAVQAKRYSNKVGLHAVQEVVSAMSHYNCNDGIVITNNYFTRACKKLSKSNGITLWNREKLRDEIISQNKV